MQEDQVQEEGTKSQQERDHEFIMKWVIYTMIITVLNPFKLQTIHKKSKTFICNEQLDPLGRLLDRKDRTL